MKSVHPDRLMDFYYKLDKKYEHIKVLKAGLSDGDRPIYTVILSKKNHFTPESKQNDLVVMINNGIHSGESCGIDASQLLARQILKDNFAGMESSTIVIIPVYNVGGHQKFSKFNRINQNGPEKMGFRGNARNFDLNRDFMKMDTQNAFVFKSIFHGWNPDIFIDNHATNGADYQHVLTYMINETAHNLEPMHKNTFKVRLEKSSSKKGIIPTTYMNLRERGNIKAGINYFHLSPRYSTGYTEQFHTISILIETHMLKAYKKRVMANKIFMLSTLETAQKEKDRIQSIREKTIETAKSMNTYVINWERDTEKFESIPFLAYDYASKFNKFAGVKLVEYDRLKPISFDLKVYNFYNEVKRISVAKAYIIPKQWYRIIKRLKASGVKLRKLRKDQKFKVEQYRFKTNAKWNKLPCESHVMLKEFDYVVEKDEKLYRRGDFYIEMKQAANQYLMEALEPDGKDSFLRWGFFNIIFQQKEYFSPYLIVEKLTELLKKNPNLEAEFNEYLKKNHKLQKNRTCDLIFSIKNRHGMKVTFICYIRLQELLSKVFMLLIHFGDLNEAI